MKMQRICAGLLVAMLGVVPRCMPQSMKAQSHAESTSAREQTRRFLELPLDFEINNGQAPAAYAFVAHGPSYALGISSSGLALTLHRSQRDESERAIPDAGVDLPGKVHSSGLRINLLGAAKDAPVTGLNPQPGHSNYFIGNDPSKWQTSISHFNRVKIAEAYPGIDLIFYGNRQQLEYDFTVAPEADPGCIRLQAEGAQTVGLDGKGNAILHTAAGDVELQRPAAYQQIAGVRHTVESSFRVTDGKLLQFELGNYDHTRELVIDPVLVYGVEVGGSNGNDVMGLAVDSTGNAYISGITCSADFPSTPGNYGTLPTDASLLADCSSAFVVKMDPAASSLIYSDFFGGKSVFSAGGHLAIDSSGDVFLAGATGAPDFPTVANIGPTSVSQCGVESSGENCPVGFILKLSPDGSQILFSSLLGGNQATLALQVKLNPVTGDLVVLGNTNSSNFLPAPTTLQTTIGGGTCYSSNPCFDAFVLGLNPATGALRYGTFIGGSSNDWGSGLAFDSSGNIYVAGGTHSPSLPSLGAATHTYPPSGGATQSGGATFITKLNLSANQLTPGYLTMIQGDGDTAPGAIAVDGPGNLYVAGATAAQHLPVTAGVFQSTNKGTLGAVCLWPRIAAPYLPNACGAGLTGKLDTTGALSFLTYLGGTGQDIVQAIGLDSSNNLWLGGVTSSSDFPVSADKYGNGLLGYSSPFLAEMSNDGTHLPFATLVGGGPGFVSDVVVDSSNNVYIAGFAGSALTTPGTYPSNPQVYIAAFAQKWGPGLAPTMTITPSNFSFPEIAAGGSSAPQTITVQNTSTVSLEINVQLQALYPGETPSDFPESTTCATSLAAGASCTITARFAPGPPSPICLATQNCNINSRSADLLIANNSAQGAQHITLGGIVGIGPSFYVSPNPIVFSAQAAGTTSAILYAQGGSTGDSSVSVSSIALSGPNASDFQLTLTGVGGPDCVSNPVAPGSLCDFNLTFNPPANATGTRTATLTFTDTAGDSPQVVPITGTVASANFLNISPLSLSPTFPAAIGTSTSAVLDLQNPSQTASVQVTGLVISGTNMGDFSATSSNCGALPMTVPANGTCYITVTFTPAAGASGQRVATLTVQTTPAATGLPTVALVGDAVTNSQPGMKLFEIPNPLNFGALLVGETSNAQSVLFTVSNNAPIPCAGGATTCGAPLIVNSITPGLGDYSVTSTAAGCTPFPATIASGGNCTYAAVFTPAQTGSRNTTLTIQSNDPQGTVQIPVYGTGLSLPLGEVLGSALDFGKSAIGVASPPLTTTLKNVGLTNLVMSGVTTSANFAVSASTCTGSIAPQATCTVSVTFTPPTAGYFTGTLTFADNDQFAPQQIATLTGTGATGPQLRIMPPTVNFGNQQVNVAGPAQIITLTSTGDTAIAFPTGALRSSQDFILQSTTCGASLPPGASCSANLQFKPTVVTGIAEFGTLLISDNAPGNPQLAYLQGTATQGVGLVSTTSLVSSLNPSTSGQSVTFTATVAGPSGNTTVPTGTVTFYDGVAVLGTGTLNASGQVTYSTSALSVANHNINASYGGDSNFVASVSGSVIQVVNASTLPATTTALTSSANPSTSGQTVTFTATVAGPSGNTTVPTGSVSFLDGATTIGTGTLNGSGQATFSTASLSVASHSITAAYGGSTTFAGSTSAILTQVVNQAAKAATTSAVSSSLNPSTIGQSVTFTATVTGPSGNTTIPTGTVNFVDGATTLGSGTLNAAGVATYSTASLAAGSHSVTAVYAGDATFNGSTSTALAQVVNAPVKLATTSTVTSSLNPSGQGQSVTFTATVTGPAGNATVPTGAVTFMDAASTLGSGTVNASGQATYTTTALSAGSHSITAVYGGDATFAGSSSAALTQTVGTPSFTVSANPTTATVTAGQSATTVISVTPTFGFNQQVSFACSGLPTAATCTFSPSTLTPSSASAVTTTLTIATNVATASLTRPAPLNRRESSVPSQGLLALVLLGLGGLVRMRRSGLWKGNATRWLLGLALLAAIGMSISACGGKSNNTTTGKTPPGTSTITVTATAGSITQNSSFTLTVQ